MSTPRSDRSHPRQTKASLHPRNRHQGHYDLPALAAAEPSLQQHLRTNAYGNLSLDFANPESVKALNRALLRLHYRVDNWDIPAGYLCPPIPGRADYLHHAADLLATDDHGRLPHGPSVRVLDIGTGANLVYPLIGQHDYGWQFVGVDIDPTALANAERILAANPLARANIRLRQQRQPSNLFAGVIQVGERFALTVCNPPFHASRDAADADTARKWRGLQQSAGRSEKPTRSPSTAPASSTLNFGGQANELVCEGGETGFILRMIAESTQWATQVGWFTCLVSRAEHLTTITRALKRTHVAAHQTVAMAQGQKQSRFIAWSFLPPRERRRCRETVPR